MCKQFRNDIIPERIKNMIDRYVDNGISGGGCLDAILSNNLREAFGRADEEARERMFDIVRYLYNNVPAACWGSPDLVANWMRRGGREGIKKVVPRFKVGQIVELMETGEIVVVVAILEYNNNIQQWTYECSLSEKHLPETSLKEAQ